MRFVPFPSIEKRPRADVCCVPFAKEASGAIAPLFEDAVLLRTVRRLLDTSDFQAKEGEAVILYPDSVVASRLMVLGLGSADGMTMDRIRLSYAKGIKQLRKKSVTSLTCITPSFEHVLPKLVYRSMLEGLFFGTYSFQEYRTKKDAMVLNEVGVLSSAPQPFLEVEREVVARMDAVSFCRDLVNRNADEMNPQRFAEVASTLEKDGLRVLVHGKNWIEQQRMGLLLAVGQGAQYEPQFIVAEWKGDPQSHEKTVLVGKGITFDTGGLDLKSFEQMKGMKGDMAGAAAVLGVMQAVRDLKLPLNVTALIPLCENSIGSRAYKPDDVYRARSGKSVEITSTDAEGRLILADALDYAVKEENPSRIIDVATLTGAAEVALGSEISALFTNTDSLAYELEQASIHAGEPLWKMPLHIAYEDLLDSEIADCKNVGSRSGGAITAAVFLHGFVGSTPWAHFDIAGTSLLKEPRRYFGKGSTGVPVRTLIDYLITNSISDL